MIGQIKVGVGFLIIYDGKIFLAKRKSELGNGKWGSGGGHLEFGETIEQGVKREAFEEYGVEVEMKKILSVKCLFENEHHYLDITTLTELKKGEPKIMEPEKFSEFGWFDLNNLPENLFPPVQWAIENLKNGKGL